MDAVFKFFYPVIVETQVDFEGRPHDHDVFLEGHIVYKGRLMCGESREVIMNRSKAKKSKELEKRTISKVCPVCLQAWRECPESPYYRYVNGVPAKVTVVEKNVVEMQF